MMGIDPAASQTLTNSDFDSDLSGWQVVPFPQHDWSVLDHEDDPASGSLLAHKDSPGGGLLQATQCVEVEPGDVNTLLLPLPAQGDSPAAPVADEPAWVDIYRSLPEPIPGSLNVSFFPGGDHNTPLQ